MFDALRGTLTRDGVPVSVGNRGIALLKALLQAENGVVGKAVLMDAAWPGLIVEESNLSVQIASLRKLLGPAPAGGEWIATVPRVGYRFAGPVTTDGGDAARPQDDRRAEPARRPTLAVLPFINISGDADQEYLADGITEDIITALARFRWFFVSARNSSFVYKAKRLDAKQAAQELGVHYLLEGSVRRSGERVRISAELVDAAAGAHLWVERYDLEMTEIFAIQDEIAERVAGAIEPELLKTEAALAAMLRTGDRTAWDLVRQGTWRFHQVQRATHLEARELFRRACRLDPYLSEAHCWLARVNAGLLAYGWSDDPAEDRQEGLSSALTAVRLDEKNPYSHYSLAIISVYSGHLDQAIRAAEKAVELSPSFALGHLVGGMARLFGGRAAEAIAPLSRGLRLSPFDPQNFVWCHLLAFARLFAGEAEGALQAALRGLQVRPDWRPGLETVLCCHVALGRIEEARRLAAQAGEPSAAPGNVLVPLRERNPHWAAMIDAMLRTAAGDE